jgi:hypothetical protein
MKYTNCNILGAILVTGTLAAVNNTSAQVLDRVETAVTSEGTISEFGPQMLIVKSDTATEGVRYTYSKTTTYVDEAGQPVSIKTVKSGLPVTVYYTKVGDSMVATKVIVRKAAAPPAFSTSVGTIGEYGHDRLTVTTTTSPEAVRYSYSKTTTYVDEDGNPVSVTTVKSGAPVTLQYTKVGDTLMVSKVIVRKNARIAPPPVPALPPVPTLPAPPPIVETKKTTTTTRTEK